MYDYLALPLIEVEEAYVEEVDLDEKAMFQDTSTIGLDTSTIGLVDNVDVGYE